MIYVEDKNLVIPGQILADDEYYPGRGTFKEDGKVCSSLMGLVSLRNKKIRVIPLKSKYVPKKGDVVIGKINDVRFSMWDVNINSPYSGILPAFEVFGRDKKELSKVYDVGDVLFLRVIDVDEVKKAKLGLKGRGLGKFKGGIIVDISPTKVPRLIGKKGSMINMIKNKTNCKIVVGQNGLVWVKGDDDMEQLTREIIHTIEVEAHTSGLTNKIKNKLCLAIDGELPVEETDEEFVLEKPKLQNFKEELEQEEREKAEAEVQDDAGEDGESEEVEAEVQDDAGEDSGSEEVEAEENNDAEDKPNFYDVIKELKKKSQNKKDKNISYSDNSNNNSFILNNR
ncbi:MAG: exosome complex protein Rrp4 [Methanobrevibacter sp.]|uniref:exosome complex RNA-binding protein Rrp4 n=1 Tax=uncultured Methanobrevibacter sp. TaxID=253161 RepID=UPI0037437052|nr:exosome complex protein Rrp4 [Methanobrevibacter sp.]